MQKLLSTVYLSFLLLLMLGVSSKNPLPKPSSWKNTPVFSPKSSMVLVHTLRLFTHSAVWSRGRATFFCIWRWVSQRTNLSCQLCCSVLSSLAHFCLLELSWTECSLNRSSALLSILEPEAKGKISNTDPVFIWNFHTIFIMGVFITFYVLKYCIPYYLFWFLSFWQSLKLCVEERSSHISPCSQPWTEGSYYLCVPISPCGSCSFVSWKLLCVWCKIFLSVTSLLGAVAFTIIMSFVFVLHNDFLTCLVSESQTVRENLRF